MNSTRTALVGAAVALACAIAFLFVQDKRHGWPFAAHHIQVSTEHQSESRTNETSAQSATQRVAFDLPETQFEKLGIRFEPAVRASIANPVRAVATITADESRISHVHTRVAGWLEELYVNTTGQTVRAGQPLAAVFSQELYSSQQEYLLALRRANAGPSSALLDAARTRLTVLGMSEAEIQRLEQRGQAARLVTVAAPRNGVVLNRAVSAGTAVDPSTEILTIADLSTVWVIAEIPERDAARVSVGSTATLSFPMAGLESFAAKVEFVYPTLSERTRAVRVRLPVANRDGKLRPGMYGSAEFAAVQREALTVVRDAVVDTGESQHVFVHNAQGELEPRSVKVGSRLGDRIEIVDGLAPGEHVVTTGVFLIDSESRLRASGGTGHVGHGGSNTPSKSDSAQPTEDHSQHVH